MMGLAQIEAESRRAARSSAQLHLMPLVVWEADEVTRAPFLGTRVPRGWRKATYDDIGQAMKSRKGFYGNDTDLGVMLFCDSGGWGGDDEPALSGRQMHLAVEDILESNKAVTFGFGIYEVGQFQLHLRVFVKR
jgi:hypothetical protein